MRFPTYTTLPTDKLSRVWYIAAPPVILGLIFSNPCASNDLSYGSCWGKETDNGFENNGVVQSQTVERDLAGKGEFSCTTFEKTARTSSANHE
jgi:hypothetical protein